MATMTELGPPDRGIRSSTSTSSSTTSRRSKRNDAMGSSADFVAAWRTFVQVFRQEDVRNVNWTWTMTDWAFETTDERAARQLVSRAMTSSMSIGADVYNFADCAVAGRGWETFREKMTPIRAWAKDHPGKPIILPEWGSTEDPTDPGRKAAWIRDARRQLKQKAWRRVKMVLYFQTIDPAIPGATGRSIRPAGRSTPSLAWRRTRSSITRVSRRGSRDDVERARCDAALKIPRNRRDVRYPQFDAA